MKKFYRSGNLVFAILSSITVVMAIAGIVLLISGAGFDDLTLFLIGFGAPFGLLFLPLFLANVLSYITIDDESIVFPVTRAPRLRFKRNKVRYSDIEYIEIQDYKGDKIVTENTAFYLFTLKDGTAFKEALYIYGKKREREIVSMLKSKVAFK